MTLLQCAVFILQDVVDILLYEHIALSIIVAWFSIVCLNHGLFNCICPEENLCYLHIFIFTFLHGIEVRLYTKFLRVDILVQLFSKLF